MQHFFHRKLFSKKPIFLDSHSNWYAHESLSSTRPFSGQSNWSIDGKVVPASDESRSYLLSTMLAVVRFKGSSLDQALEQLTKSAAADGSQPDGVFYFANHGDPRSTTRSDQFSSVAIELRKLGFKVEIGAETMPKNETVLGATLGSPSLDWPQSKSEFAPGAICDNFTSYAGWWQKSQTHLTHFLNSGAAGAVGTVYEPYTIPWKIPTAATHLHYVRGCTLAESIYQTVVSPFQLLIVGDPLCRPFAALPDFTVKGIVDRTAIREDLQIELTAKPSKHKIQRYDIFMDGIFDRTVPPDQTVKIPIADLTGGYHEIRITAFDDSVAQVSQTKAFTFFIVPHDLTEEKKLKLRFHDLEVGLNDKIKVACNFPKSWKVHLFQNSRVVGEFLEPNKPILIDASLLGRGKTKLYPAAVVEQKTISGVPAEVTIGIE